MSEENVEVVRRLYELQFTPEFFEVLDPNVVWINYASAPETRPYLGHEGVSEWAAGFQRHIGDLRFEPIELIDAGGDQVVAIHRVTAKGVAGGMPLEQTGASVITVLNGKIVKVHGFETRTKALEAAGLSE
jgi:ketosteroid isomerase-like protein